MDSIFIQLAIILGLASILGFITVRFKLPLLVAYLLGGLVIASFSLFDARSAALSFLPEIGIAFVLFLVGMELDLREIKSLGKPILVAGILQVAITTIIGSSIAKNLGFDSLESWYLGLGLSFSSTIVVIKLLVDKRELTSLYGKLAVGILLLEDLLAVLLLLFLTAAPSVLNLGLQQQAPFLTFVLKAGILFALAIILNRFLLNFIFQAVARSSELLFLTALAWCFIYISFATLLGFSVLIGAFLAGVALASSPYHFQIQGKVKPLREFFVTLFFVYLGTQVNFADLTAVYPLILILVSYTLFLKPALFLLILGAFGFRKHTMFQTSISLTHISEFSLILMLVGFRLGVVSQGALTAIAFSTVLSMLLASFMIAHSSKIYPKLKEMIGFFERKNLTHKLEEQKKEQKLQDHVVVVGGHRVGGEIVRFLQREKIAHVVLDFNPDHVASLQKIGANAIFGDMRDPEVLDQLALENSQMIVSTDSDLEDNLLLLEDLKTRKLSLPVILRAETVDEAENLYKAGADFVIIPEVLAGDFLTEKLEKHFQNKDYFKDRAKVELEKLSRKTLAWE